MAYWHRAILACEPEIELMKNKQASVRPWPLLRFCMTCGLVCVPGAPAWATTEMALQFETSLQYDSNPFRFVNGVNGRATLGTEATNDAVYSNDLHFSVAHPLDSPDTRLVFTGLLGKRNYRQFPHLDHTEYAYRGGLEWRWSQLWKGEFIRAQEQKLYDYQDGTITDREMKHRTTDVAGVTLRISPSIDVSVAMKLQHLSYDTAVNLPFESEERGADSGIIFRSGSGSSLRTGVKTNDVKFLNRTALLISTADNRYRDDELYFDADWQYSVLTRFSGRVAKLERRYDSLKNMNFTATTLEASAMHDHSPKTRITLNFWNRPSGSSDPAMLYTTVTGGQVAVRWQTTEKTRFNLQYGSELEKYKTTTAWVGQPDPELKRTRFGASMVYTMTRDIAFYVEGFNEYLNRGSIGSGISQRALRAGLEYTFEGVPGTTQQVGLSARR